MFCLRVFSYELKAQSTSSSAILVMGGRLEVFGNVTSPFVNVTIDFDSTHQCNVILCRMDIFE